jgi:putative transposase
MATAEVFRRNGLSPITFYKLKANCGGMDVSDAQRLKALEDENGKLKRLLADAMLDKIVLKDLLGWKHGAPVRDLLQPCRGKIVIEGWRKYYNAKRPYSSLGNGPPAPEAMQWPAPPSRAASPAPSTIAPGPVMH